MCSNGHQVCASFVGHKIQIHRVVATKMSSRLARDAQLEKQIVRKQSKRKGSRNWNPVWN